MAGHTNRSRIKPTSGVYLQMSGVCQSVFKNLTQLPLCCAEVRASERERRALVGRELLTGQLQQRTADADDHWWQSIDRANECRQDRVAYLDHRLEKESERGRERERVQHSDPGITFESLGRRRSRSIRIRIRSR